MFGMKARGRRLAEIDRTLNDLIRHLTGWGLPRSLNHISGKVDAIARYLSDLAIASKLDRLESSLSKMEATMATHTEALERLTTEVGESVTKMQELAQLVRDNVGNAAALQDAANRMDAMASALDAAQTAATDPPTE